MLFARRVARNWTFKFKLGAEESLRSIELNQKAIIRNGQEGGSGSRLVLQVLLPRRSLNHAHN